MQAKTSATPAPKTKHNMKTTDFAPRPSVVKPRQPREPASTPRNRFENTRVEVPLSSSGRAGEHAPTVQLTASEQALAAFESQQAQVNDKIEEKEKRALASAKRKKAEAARTRKLEAEVGLPMTMLATACVPHSITPHMHAHSYTHAPSSLTTSFTARPAHGQLALSGAREAAGGAATAADGATVRLTWGAGGWGLVRWCG